MALGKVLSPNRACVSCRSRKRRCDGEQPCERCKRMRVECEFVQPKLSTRTERLEAKIEELEAKIDALNNDTSSVSVLSQFPTSTTWQQDVLSHPLFAKDRASRPTPILISTPFFPYPIWEDVKVLDWGPDPSGVYTSSISLAAVEDRLALWDVSRDVPREVAEYLIRIFLPFRSRFKFFANIPVLLRSIRLAPSDERSAHPAVLYAIYLIACSIVGGAATKYEPILLARARENMESALAFVDRLLDFLTASALIFSYYQRSGRITEAQTLLAATVQFAVGCQLHLGAHDAEELDDDDLLHHIQRESLWASIYLADQELLRSAALPSSVPAQCVPVLDPRTLSSSSSDLCSLLPFPSSQVNLRDLGTFNLTADTEMIRHIKVTSLYDASVSFVHGSSGAVGRAKDPSSLRKSYDLILESITESQRTLPLPTDTCSLLPLERASENAHPVFHPRIVLHASTILLLTTALQDDQLKNDYGAGMPILLGKELHTHYERRLSAALDMADLAKTMRGSTLTGRLAPLHGDLDCIFPVHLGCRVLLREMQKVHAEVKEADAEDDPDPACCSAESKKRELRFVRARQALQVLLDFLQDLLSMFPAEHWVYCVVDLRNILMVPSEFDLSELSKQLRRVDLTEVARDIYDRAKQR